MEVIERDSLDALLGVLRGRGFTVIGPTVREGAIVYDRVSSADEMPRGLSDEQDGGTYRLVRRDDDALFGYAAGPQSWKRYLHPPKDRAFGRAQRRTATTSRIREEPEEPPRYAYIGVRSCELHAIAHPGRGAAGGRTSRSRLCGAGARARSSSRSTAARPAAPASACRWRPGPRADFGYDLALTEIIEAGRHWFRSRSAASAGQRCSPSSPPLRPASRRRAAETARSSARLPTMGRELETDGIKELLYRNYEHPRWDEVSERCLTCGNCTMVCPTCFCTTVEDVTDLDGRGRRARPRMGLVLHDGLLLRARRQRPLLAASRATGSG